MKKKKKIKESEDNSTKKEKDYHIEKENIKHIEKEIEEEEHEFYL